ncbi:hypothetical protein C8R44DRAFT_797437 [Mycena epipterygia]|nr:hypothetical protein C8R44DRAFT_797437 [Mycena epipterygia]
MELLAGVPGDNRNDVVDIIVTNATSHSEDADISYQFHTGTPAGTYYVRMNGTIYSGATRLSSTTATSTTAFNFTGPPNSTCNTPVWTPVRSLTDPNYSPLRLATPAGGDMFTQADLENFPQSIPGTLATVDALFDPSNMNMTMEVINTVTGFNAGVQTIAPDDTAELLATYSTKDLTLDPGTWQLRVNFTSTSPANPGSFVAVSDEFFVTLNGTCVGNTAKNSTASPSATSPDSAGSSGVKSPSKNAGSSLSQPWVLHASIWLFIWTMVKII